MQTKAKNSTDLHILTEKVSMKFYPKLRDSKPKSKSTIEAPSQSRVSGLLSWFGNRSTQSEIQDSSEESKVSIPETKQEEPSKLKFAERISPEHLLIGNELQVDLISIASITTGNFVDTEHLWSLSYDENIHLVNVDNRSNFALMQNITYWPSSQAAASTFTSTTSRRSRKRHPPLKRSGSTSSPSSCRC